MRILNKTEQYAQQVLDALYQEGSLDPQSRERFWRGKMTDLIHETVPKAHPGYVSKLLQASNAITITTAGAGGRPSEIKINRSKIFETDDGLAIDVDTSTFTSSPTQVLRQDIHSVNKRVLTLETQVSQLIQAIQFLQTKIFASQAMDSYGPASTPSQTPASTSNNNLDNEQSIKARIEALMEGPNNINDES